MSKRTLGSAELNSHCEHPNRRPAARLPAGCYYCPDCTALFRQLGPVELRDLHVRTRGLMLTSLADRVEAECRMRQLERENCEQHGLELVPFNTEERAAFERLSRAVAALLNQ